MRTISWYINRLSKMSLPEIFYRLEHNFLKSADKFSLRLNYSPIKPLTSNLNLSPCFLLSQSVSRREPSLQEHCQVSVVKSAKNFLSNNHNIFGLTHHYKDKINWHLDPKTGNQWPLSFWGDINIRDGHTIGGPKFAWEINRLYCLPILGMACQVTGEEKYGSKLFGLIDEWLAANPYPLGINWTSGIELGIRIANLVWSLSFLQNYTLTEHARQNLNQFIVLHARHLYRYPAKYSSNNNHALAEAFGLFLAGVFFPHLKGAASWQSYGKEVLEREIVRQILPDGGSYECSTTYLSFVFDFFLLYRLVCERLQLSYAPEINKRLERSCEFIFNLIDRNGNIPNIGDQDSAILVNFGLDNQENFRSILNTGSILFNRPELRQPNFPDLKTCILLADSVQKQNIEETDYLHPSAILLQESGLGVIRSQLGNRKIVFTGNATPLGMPPLYAHGHLDALSFTLSVDGQEIFVDPGTYLYHSGGKWRRYFRSTAAHNTIRINETELTEQVADFMFGKPYSITQNTLSHNNAQNITWCASHNAYEQLANPVQLQREVTFVSAEQSFVFSDSMKSDEDYLVELFFHLHPQCTVTLAEQNAAISLNDHITVMMQFDKKVDLMCYKGSNEPLAGWFSPKFNEIQECCTIVARVDCSGATTLQTKISLS